VGGPRGTRTSLPPKPQAAWARAGLVPDAAAAASAGVHDGKHDDGGYHSQGGSDPECSAREWHVQPPFSARTEYRPTVLSTPSFVRLFPSPRVARLAGELNGERIRLRPVGAEHADRLTEILREPEVARWWGEYDDERVRQDLIEPESDKVVYAIEADSEVIGLIQYYEETDPDYRHASIDLFLATAWQGRGYGSEAIRVVARHLIEERGHHRLTIDPSAANERAIRAYERVGFRPVGVMRRYERAPDGTWRDGLLMDLLASELRP
jgi:aminoglycoside 6'-N-acetyltransferase